MPRITIVSTERAERIRGNTVVAGVVNQDNRHLILTKGNGTTIDAGEVRPVIPPYPPAPAPVRHWPVGSIFMSTSADNPALALGGGTWVRWGKGRSPASLDEDQGEFNTPELVGGEKTHVLSNGEMPAHSHGGATGGRNADHSHVYGTWAQVGATGIGSIAVFGRGPVGQTNTGGSSNDHAHAIGADGSNFAHNNLQPYITCYMWKRTA